MARNLALLAILAIAAAISSCTATYDPGSHEHGAAGYFESTAVLFCEANARCCEGSDVRPTDICIAVYVEYSDRFLAAAEDPRLGYDSGRAAANLAEYQALAAACDPGALEVLLAFDDLIAGTQHEGESCAPLTPNPAGDPLAFLQCTDGLTCQWDLTTGFTCSAMTLPGAGEPCATGLCDELSYCMDNTCAAKLANGASCTLDDQCAEGLCLDVPRVCKAPTREDAFCRLIF